MKRKKEPLSEDQIVEKQMLQWHPAFYADLQIELKEEQRKLIREQSASGQRKKQLTIF